MSKVSKGTMSKFKSINGTFLTKALFLERNDFENKDGVLYTLGNEDTPEFPSLKKIYFNLDDPTEYKVATTCFDGWEHWLHLCEVPWFKERVESWRQELSVKRASEGLDLVVAKVRNGGKDSLIAAKYLLTNGWLAKDQKSTRARRGRPTKNEVRKASTSFDAQVNEDADRVLN